MTSQAEFRRALLDPASAVPAGLVDPRGRPAGKRFDIYRNNVIMTLIEALESSFPISRKIVGDEFFAEMARVYLRQNLPTSPVLMYYGEAMPEFLTGFGPAQHLGYLPDIARLELALRQSYHAQDSRPVEPALIATLAQENLPFLRLTFAPAIRLIRSPWPIHAIWAFNTQPDAAKPVMRPEDVLVLRPGFDPLPHLVPAGGGALIAALIEGQPLGQAIEVASETDLTAVLGILIQGGAIHSFSGEAS